MTFPKPKPKGCASYGAHTYAIGPSCFFILAFTLTQIGSTIVWVLLGVYAKQNYHILENQYGLIPMTNAIMVVLLQVIVTTRSKQYQPTLMLALGAFLYAAGVTSVAFASGFWGFWISMVVITCGELVLVPTATTFVANIAPPAMRGRYMSIFSLCWGVASGIGPVVGGYLNDTISPQAIWYGGGAIGLLGAIWFLIQSQKQKSFRSCEQPRKPETWFEFYEWVWDSAGDTAKVSRQILTPRQTPKLAASKIWMRGSMEAGSGCSPSISRALS